MHVWVCVIKWHGCILIIVNLVLSEVYCVYNNVLACAKEMHFYVCVDVPSPRGEVILTRESCLSILAKFDQFRNNPECGPVSYDVIISPSNGVAIKITTTSFNFTRLIPNNNYTVTVTGRDNAGVGTTLSDMMPIGKHYSNAVYILITCYVAKKPKKLLVIT